MTLNTAQVGFGAAVLAGLILAFIGHPGPHEPKPRRDRRAGLGKRTADVRPEVGLG
jgi:hypothetical protein